MPQQVLEVFADADGELWKVIKDTGEFFLGGSLTKDNMRAVNIETRGTSVNFSLPFKLRPKDAFHVIEIISSNQQEEGVLDGIFAY